MKRFANRESAISTLETLYAEMEKAAPGSAANLRGFLSRFRDSIYWRKPPVGAATSEPTDRELQQQLDWWRSEHEVRTYCTNCGPGAGHRTKDCREQP